MGWECGLVVVVVGWLGVEGRGGGLHVVRDIKEKVCARLKPTPVS